MVEMVCGNGMTGREWREWEWMWLEILSGVDRVGSGHYEVVTKRVKVENMGVGGRHL